MGTFSATISEFTGATKQAMLAVQRGSAQEVAERITRPVAKGGRLRVDTGYLRASLMASTAAMPSINPNARPAKDAAPGSYTFNDGDVSLQIANAGLGDTIYLGFTAAYAQFRENKDMFVETVALSFPAIVAEQEAKAKAAFNL